MVFKVGQRVKYSGRAGYDNDYYEQITGRVIVADCNRTLVEFDRYIKGHDGLGDSEMGSCWWFDNDELLKGVQLSNICINIRKLI